MRMRRCHGNGYLTIVGRLCVIRVDNSFNAQAKRYYRETD